MTTTITYHPEKEFGYQWKLVVKDSYGYTRQCFETKELAERYVIMSMLCYGNVN